MPSTRSWLVHKLGQFSRTRKSHVFGALAALWASACFAGSGPTVPYNEAVKVVNGKRVVQLPSRNPYMPDEFVRPIDGPYAKQQLFMIETQDGLVQCVMPYVVAKACQASSFGSEKRNRTWVVLKDGEWRGCIGLQAPKQCRAIYPKRGSPENKLGGVIPREVS